jgi:tetratricopeptide (TPR) repeat protein
MAVDLSPLREKKVLLIGGALVILLALGISAALAPTPRSQTDILTDKFKSALRREDFSQAKKVADERAAFGLKKFKADTPEHSQFIHDQGLAMLLLGEPDEALPFLEQAVALDIKFRGIKDSNLGRKMVTLAEAKLQAGQIESAAKVASKADEIMADGADERLVKFRLQAKTVLAQARLELADCNGAAELASDNLELARKSLPKEGALIQRIATTAGKASHCAGRVADAEEYIGDAVAIARRRKNDDLPSLLALQGELLCELGRCKQGAKLQERSFKAAQKIFGADSDRAAEFARPIEAEEAQPPRSSAQLLGNSQEAEPLQESHHFEQF